VKNKKMESPHSLG